MFRALLGGALFALISLFISAQQSDSSVVSKQTPAILAAQEQIAELDRLIREQRWDSAAELGNKILTHSPNNSGLLFWLGYVQSQRRDFIDAIPLLRTAEKLQPHLPNVDKVLAGCYYDIGQYLLFRHAIQRAIEQSPHDAELYYLLGYYQLSVRLDYDAASIYFRRALDEQPNQYRFRYFLGYAYECKGEKQKAQKQFLKSIEQCEATKACEFELAYRGMARVLFDTNPRQALKYAHRAVEIDSSSSDANLWLGKTCIKVGEIPNAVNALLKVCALDPTSTAARYLLFTAYKAEGDRKASAKYLAEYKRLSSLYGPE